MTIKSETIKLYDMTCTSCERIIETNVKKLKGVLYVKADYKEQKLSIDYDSELCSMNDIKQIIISSGYSFEKTSKYKFLGILVLIVAIVFLSKYTTGYNMNTMLNGASYFIIFLVGILTSLHCVGMCGGIMLSQTIKKDDVNRKDSMKPAILYNLGRVISYTILGGLVGLLGSVFSLSIKAQGSLQIFAALFMILTGLNIIGVRLFKKLSLCIPFKFCSIKNKSKTPFIVGLLNSLMPCGPLQTMQLYALSTGSFVKGALSMLIFSLGTVPLMLGFGLISSLLNKKTTKNLLKFSGILIIILGIMMGQRGLSLIGINMPFSDTLSNISSGSSKSNIVKAVVKDGIQQIKITADESGYTPNVICVKKGIPIKLTIYEKQLTACNNKIIFPSLGIEKSLNEGENLIEFTPNEGDINFSCWMGMIRGVVKVVDNLDTVNNLNTKDTSLPPSGAGGCCSIPN